MNSPSSLAHSFPLPLIIHLIFLPAMAIENGAKATIPTVDANGAATDTLAEDVIQGLKIAGACIIKNLYNQDIIDKFEAEVKPHLTEAGNLTCKFIVPPTPLFDIESYFVGTAQTSKRMSSPPPD